LTQLTPLDKIHHEHLGRMVDFAGFSLPIQYPDGIINEHIWTRQKASLFDVSHMGQLFLQGPNVISFLEKITPSSYGNLSIGQMKYSVLTNDQGGIIDDLMITRIADDHFYLVVNGACFEKDLAHLQKNLPTSVTLTPLMEEALVAIQGPKAESILSTFDPTLSDLHFLQAKTAKINEIVCWVSRSGYTGEDGFEIAMHKDNAIKLVETLLKNPDLKLAGLGARDSLRLEAGLPLYGHDLDDTISPVKAGLSFVISKEQRLNPHFLGHEFILNELKNHPNAQRVCILPEGKIMVREGTKLLDQNHKEIGIVTSGSFSPHRDGPIAMGYIQKPSENTSIFDPIFALVRDVPRPCTITKLPFLNPHYKRKNVA
jgi:aminomethyltransferase